MHLVSPKRRQLVSMKLNYRFTLALYKNAIQNDQTVLHYIKMPKMSLYPTWTTVKCRRRDHFPSVRTYFPYGSVPPTLAKRGGASAIWIVWSVS